MNTAHETIELETAGGVEILDITDAVTSTRTATDICDGVLTVFIGGATAAITTLEAEPGAIADLKDCIERIAPRGIPYAHDAAYGDGNGHSHVRAALLKPEVTIPVIDRVPALGTWQRIVFIELDNRPRSRRVLVQGVGTFA